MFTFHVKMSIIKALLTKKSPYYVQYYINGRCNLKCKQCNIVEFNSGLHEADLGEVEKIAKNLRKIGAGIILLTGGEPFLRGDLPEMVSIFKANDLDVRLQTAGMKVATPAQLQRCYDAGARDINVSLDSLDPAKQEYINSVPGSWHTAIETISNISKIFSPEAAICSLGCVLSRYNYKEIPSILAFATKIGWYLSLVPVHITTVEDPFGFRSYDKTFKFRPEDIPGVEAVVARLIEMKKQGYKLFDSVDFLNSTLSFIKTGKPTWRKDDVCDSPSLYFAVRPSGEMAVCCDHTIPGKKVSLVDDDFPAVYRSAEFHGRVRQKAAACSGCHYGSYPEVTLSVRSFKTLIERIFVTLKSQRNTLVPYSYDEMLNIISSLRAEAPDVYDKTRHPDQNNNDIILKWETPEGQKELQAQDRLTREREGRVRKKSAHDSAGAAQ